MHLSSEEMLIELMKNNGIRPFWQKSEVDGDIISDVEGRGSKIYLWAKFHDYSSYRFGAMHISTDGRTDTILVAMGK